MPDFIKATVLANGFLIIAPLAGFILSKDRRLEDCAVYGFLFLLGLHINTTVLVLGSIEWYRGVTKGYEFSMMDVVALSLILATVFKKERPFVLLPLGTLLWLCYVGSSSLSLFTSLNSNYVFMSILKFGKAWLIVWAMSNYIRSRREIHVVLSGLSIMLIYQFFIVAKMKWIDGFHQVRGLFEHQNPLAMFTYMAALPILAAAMSPGTGKARSMVYLFTFACSAVIVLATLSRAALAVFAVGTAAVVLVGFFDRPSSRRFISLAFMSVGGLILLAATADTIISRFNDRGNDASGETREVMNLAAKAMLDANPLGVGWNNFGKAINHPYPYGDVIDDWNRDRGMKVDKDYAKGVVESHYWLLKAETGWPGFLTYTAFILFVLVRPLPLILTRRGTLEAAVVLGIAVAFALTYVHSTLERVLTQTKNLALWMTLVGLLGALIRLPRPENREENDEG